MVEEFTLEQLNALSESELVQKFEATAKMIKEGVPNPNSTNEDKLKVYALFKQATVGDNSGSQPWAVQLEARAKWDAWEAEKGKDKATAMKEYILEIARQDKVLKEAK